MSSDQIVRKPLRVRERSARTLDERLSLRFPSLAAASYRLIGRLPPRSRLRQAALWRAIRLAVEAYNRRDLDAVAIGFPPDLEYYPYREFVEAGLAEPCYRGPAGYRTYIEGTYEVWGADVRYLNGAMGADKDPSAFDHFRLQVERSAENAAALCADIE